VHLCAERYFAQPALWIDALRQFVHTFLEVGGLFHERDQFAVDGEHFPEIVGRQTVRCEGFALRIAGTNHLGHPLRVVLRERGGGD
jgi:hypothetical protein